MTTVYPTSKDSFDRPTPSSSLSGHAALHDDLADAIESIENVVGVTGDTTAGTVQKRLADLEGKDFTITFGTGSDLSGSVTVTNLGDVTNTTVAVRDDSHNHIISNVDGLQTALDAKLASSSYTAADVLTKIKTVDGSGSGLDADTVDGLQSSAFARSSGRQSITSCGLTGASYTGASLVLDATAGSQPSFSFPHYWSGTLHAPQIRIAQDIFYFRDKNDGDGATISVNTIQSRNPSLNSSRTIKHDIETFTGDATAIVDGLETVTFRYNDGDTEQQHLGFIAEDVATVFPMAVDQSGDTPTLNIAHIIALSVAGLQEANTRIAELEAKVTELEAR
jgi:hypothetical protein